VLSFEECKKGPPPPPPHIISTQCGVGLRGLVFFLFVPAKAIKEKKRSSGEDDGAIL